MASPWGKFLAPIVVPTGGWNFVYVDSTGTQTATVAAGTYANILTLCDELHDKIEVESGADTCVIAVTSVGIVSILITEDFDSITWASTNDDLEAALGLDGTETVSSNTITANNRHTYGWYPGVISFANGNTDTTHGGGITRDSGWKPDDVTKAIISGSGKARIIGPARFPMTRTLSFGPLHRDEVFEDRSRGVVCLMDKWRTDELYWYPDRTVGTVGSSDDQGDPGDPDYDVDADCDYWLVTQNRASRITPAGGNPDWFNVQLVLNGEPD
jgi:hypothetical protein